MVFPCDILKGCNANGVHCALMSGPCSGMADSKVADDSVSPSTFFKGAGLSLPNTGGLGWRWFLPCQHSFRNCWACVLTSYLPLSLSYSCHRLAQTQGRRKNRFYPARKMASRLSGGQGLKRQHLGGKCPLPSNVLVETKPLSFSTGRVESWAHRLDPLGFKFQSALTSCGPQRERSRDLVLFPPL